MHEVKYRAFVTCDGKDEEDAISFEDTVTVGNNKIPLFDIIVEIAVKKAEELYPDEEFIECEIIDMKVIK